MGSPKKNSKPWRFDWLVYVLMFAGLAIIAIFVATQVLACDPDPAVKNLLIVALCAMLGVFVLMLSQMGRQLKKNADVMYAEDGGEENEEE